MARVQLLPTYDHLFDTATRSKCRILFSKLMEMEVAFGGGNFHVHWYRLKKFNTPSNDLIKSFDAQGDANQKALRLNLKK